MSTRAVPFYGRNDIFSGVFAGLAEKRLSMTGRGTLTAGTAQEDARYGKPMHNEAVVFNEDVLPRGAALHTWCAVNFLKAE